MAETERKPGFLLILNVIKDRVGAPKDTERLRAVFTKMGAEVYEKHDPTGRGVKAIMEEIRKVNFQNYSYVAVAYMSHGGEDDLVKTVNDKEIIKAQKSILVPLCNIESLNGKLKWLIMQTCRGSYDFLKLKPEGPVQLIKYPNYYAKFFATAEGMHAWRMAGQKGSYFIQTLCDRLETEYKDIDIISIMSRVRQDVEHKTMKDLNLVQRPDCEDNFPGKKFFITKGLIEDA